MAKSREVQWMEQEFGAEIRECVRLHGKAEALRQWGTWMQHIIDPPLTAAQESLLSNISAYCPDIPLDDWEEALTWAEDNAEELLAATGFNDLEMALRVLGE